jgi:hypothetical protein
MGLIQSSRQSTGGGGGGGLNITGFAVESFEQTAAFVSGAVVLSLSNTPISEGSISLDYNGQRLYFPQSWTLSGSQITILFDDPNVMDYDTPPFFQINYAY